MHSDNIESITSLDGIAKRHGVHHSIFQNISVVASQLIGVH
jgi:hypothetical protein